MSGKKIFVIRISNETFKALEKWAADEFRSVNGQVEWIISQKLLEEKRLRPIETSKKKKEKE